MNQLLKSVWDFAKTLLLAGFIAFFCIRGFIFEPFRIPSGSMVPTLLVGDFLFVSKFSYGNRIPLTDHFIWQTEPERGDIAVFKNTRSNLPGSFFGLGVPMFIKRIVALPGDKIAYQNKQLIINGEVVKLTPIGGYSYQDMKGRSHTTQKYREELGSIEHELLLEDEAPVLNLQEITVPENMYVVVGDNRDNSHDSRFWAYPNWGFVPKHDLMGRAEFIFWSWQNFVPRWERLGMSLRSQPIKEQE
ncbi:MAG: signal peptidase I [Alphaproteobacteria bacterium]|nr:signal peptidase I [Alphaproteobacteria bacterium]MDD9920383.1 signal peptidase I [Alphaproteobacteria bacterium]